ncbi:hypothetical protein [Actinomadura macrotermitis]|uniref:Uncharacterized protein n=1 Tax=Actinomadura macrotermitis TaxID=2585200 RepID=A0A7K0BSF1_9ACTN|nr:hypothetical protein [Actinomadura macrotermitis]MQY04135.1 hypothetical protein [Actinomadura macrotermitis]
MDSACSTPDEPTRRICRTPEDAFQAGIEDAKYDRPLSSAEIARLVALLRPYLGSETRARR